MDTVNQFFRYSARAVFCAVFFLASAWPHAAAADDTPAPFVLFRRETQNPDRSLPCIHPRLENPRNNLIVVSIQEGDLLRVGFYEESPSSWRLVSLRRYHAGGLALQGLPAGYPRDYTRDDEGKLFFGKDIALSPLPVPEKVVENRMFEKFRPSIRHSWDSSRHRFSFIRMTWKHVYGNYYIVTLYAGRRVTREELTTEKRGRDLRPLLGSSFDEPGSKPFDSYHKNSEKEDICLSSYDNPGKWNPYELVFVDEKDLPPDFPKGLVRWIP